MMRTAWVGAAVVGMCGSAGAAILSASANVDVISAPGSAGASLGGAGGNAVAWNERVSVNASGLSVNLIAPGNSTSATGGVVSGVFNSHMLHFSNTAVLGGPPLQIGTVRFDAPIVAVIYGDNQLVSSDGLFGSAGTVYPNAFSGRGLNTLNQPVSNVFVAGGVPDTLFFQLVPGGLSIGGVGNFLPGFDQVRVLTAVPSAGGVACFGVMGAAAGARRRR